MYSGKTMESNASQVQTVLDQPQPGGLYAVQPGASEVHVVSELWNIEGEIDAGIESVTYRSCL